MSDMTDSGVRAIKLSVVDDLNVNSCRERFNDLENLRCTSRQQKS